MPEAAIDHAQAAGDYDRVARLILELAQPAWSWRACVETVLRWMGVAQGGYPRRSPSTMAP